MRRNKWAVVAVIGGIPLLLGVAGFVLLFAGELDFGATNEPQAAETQGGREDSARDQSATRHTDRDRAAANEAGESSSEASVARPPESSDETARSSGDEAGRRSGVGRSQRAARSSTGSDGRQIRVDQGGRSGFLPRAPRGLRQAARQAAAERDELAADEQEEDQASGAHGFLADYFNFDMPVEPFPSLAHLPPTVSRVVPSPAYESNADFRLPFVPETFAARYAARLSVEQSGRYEFAITTYGDAILSINGQEVLRRDRNVDQPHGTIQLGAGSHEIVLSYLDNHGDSMLVLGWLPPEQGWQPIPEEALEPLALPEREPRAPRVEAIEPGYLQTSRRAIVRGAYFSEVPSHNTVLFRHAQTRQQHEAQVRWSDSQTVVAVVPDIAGSFEMRLGIRGTDYVSHWIPVEIMEAAFGLLGDYLEVGQQMDQMPAISSPTMTRIDPWLTFNSEHSFRLPFPAQYFAVRWEGYIEIPEPGTHTFRLSTNMPHARWRLGEREMPRQPTELELEAGLHPVVVETAYNTGYPVFRLMEYPGPISELPHDYWRLGMPQRNGTAVIPSEYLWPPQMFRSADQPRIHSTTPQPASVGRELTISGRGLQTLSGGTDVFFRPIAVNDHGSAHTGAATSAYVLTVEEERVVVRVPPLAPGEYQLTVRVGSLLSEGIRVFVEQDLGLVAEFVALAAPVEGPYDFSGEIPYLDAIDLQLPLLDSPPAQLGHGPFAARWRGFFWAHVSGTYRFVFETNAALVVEQGDRVLFEKPFTPAPVIVDDYIEIDAASLQRFVLSATFPEGNPYLRVRVMPPGAPEREVTWTDALPPLDYERRERPVIQSLQPAKLIPGQQLTITAEHLEGSRHRLLVPTLEGSNYVEREISATRDGNTLTATLPSNLAPGSLRVIVDSYRSQPRLYEIAHESPHGLRGSYYWFANTSLQSYPDVSEREPTMIRRDAVVDFPHDNDFVLPFTSENFFVQWQGYVRIETAGEYRFIVGSDDGSRLFVNQIQVLDNGGLHAYLEVEGRITLEPGVYPIRIDFFENYGRAACRLFWVPPGESEQVIIPSENLYAPGEAPD